MEIVVGIVGDMGVMTMATGDLQGAHPIGGVVVVIHLVDALLMVGVGGRGETGPILLTD